MAAKPLTTEAIALTEKKMDMTLDDIIKMSKTTINKAKNPQWASKSKRIFNSAGQDKSLRVQQFMESRSSLRQGALAQRRSNFQGNQFPLATEAAKKVSAAPRRNRAFGRSRLANVAKPRVGFPQVQQKTTNGGFAGKPHIQQQKQHIRNAVSKQRRPQTLDSLFANMKEQRLRVMSHPKNAIKRNGGGQQRHPWGRGRFAVY